MSNQNHKKELENLQQTIIKLKHTIQQQPHTIHLTTLNTLNQKASSRQATIERFTQFTSKWSAILSALDEKNRMVLDRTFTHTSPTLLDHDTRGYRESMVITDEQDDIEDSPFEKRQFNHRAESVFASEFDDDDDDDVDDVDDDVDDNKSDITKSQNARDHMSVLGDDDRDKDGSDNVEKDLLKVDLKEKLFESQKEIRTEEESEYGGGLGDGLSFGDFW